MTSFLSKVPKLLPHIFASVFLFLPHAYGDQEKRMKSALCPFQKKSARVLFDPELLHESPIEEIAEIFRGQVKQFGPCKNLRFNGHSSVTLSYRDAEIDLEVHLTQAGRIADLNFGLPRVINDSFAKIEQAARNSFPKISFFVRDLSKEAFSVNADVAMNAGTNGRVFLLREAFRAVKEGEVSRMQLLPIPEVKERVAFGILQKWKTGTKLTLDSLLQLVFLEGEPNAQDAILKFLGKENVEKGGKDLAPFLSQREFSLLSREEDVPSGKEALKARLGDLASSSVVAEFPEDRAELVNQLGWFASTSELCASALEMRSESSLISDRPSNGENPGSKESWKETFGFQARGFGVHQSTQVLQNRTGTSFYCVSVTANGASSREDDLFNQILSRLLALIRK